MRISYCQLNRKTPAIQQLEIGNRQSAIPKNQNAHEVSRELTAWAFVGIGPILLASWLRAWARLGPLGTESQGTAFLHGRLMPIATGIAHPTGWLGGFPTGRPWVFAFPQPDS